MLNSSMADTWLCEKEDKKFWQKKNLKLKKS